MEYVSFCRDACKPLWQEIDYLVHYRTNIKKLEDQAQKLNAVVVDVKFSVDEAQKRGERIKNQVEDWVRRANDKALEAQNLNNEIQANQNHRCFSTCCTPTWRSRYNLSKQAVSIAKEMGVIYGEKNFEDVSLPPISKPTAPAPVGHFMLFESTTHARDDVLKALKHDKNNNIVGIHGMGGVGKTTMVKQVAEKVMSEGLFDRVVLATVSQTVNLRKIQDSIADEELAELTDLRMLDMTSSGKIQTISPKVISRLQGLEELYLQGSFCRWCNIAEGTSEERNASLEEVINLPKLTILKVDIEKIIRLPPNVKFIPKWVKFDICISKSFFNRLINVELSKLKRVHTRTLFIDTTMSTLPDWFIEAVTEKAEMLIYSRCQDLMEILTVYDKGRLCGLKSLFVEQCDKVQCLIPFGDGIPSNPVFENLQELRIHRMESMKEIWVGQLPPGSFEKLKFLEVQNCRYLENSLLHSNIIQRLQNLEILHVTGNSIKEVFGFEGLQEGRRYLERLKELRLDSLSRLANIWKGPAKLADFRNLKTVIVVKCNKLKYFFSPSMSQGLLQLEELWVEDCFDLDEIIQKDDEITVDKITLPRLKTLALQNLAHLVNFYDGNSSLECPFLEYLHVRDCPKFRTSDFHSSKQVHFNNEGHYNILKKRYVPNMVFLTCDSFSSILSPQ
ncbi:probable disease resistance protein At4g27220 [Fagus crenata]